MDGEYSVLYPGSRQWVRVKGLREARKENGARAEGYANNDRMYECVDGEWLWLQGGDGREE